MIQPTELKTELPMSLSGGVLSTTTKVWDILMASHAGDMERVKQMAGECPELLYAQYNYTPPIHFAVREGHLDLVDYLLEQGAHDPTYRIYPFLDNLQTIALDRGFDEIASRLDAYANNPARQKFKGDNGEIHVNRSALEIEFQAAVDKGDLLKTEQILLNNPEFARDENYFWGEGILTMPAKRANFELVDLLMSYGAKVPDILKWTQAYYFERYDSAVYLMEHGMNPNTMSWHHVTILHDMAQKGNIPKAKLLLEHGAIIDAVDEEYQSTPLGMAARWGHIEMVKFLLEQGANLNKSGATWATPLEWAKKKAHAEIESILKDAGAA
jgi:ankyrin repeat protein